MTTHSTTAHSGTDGAAAALALETSPTSSSVPSFKQLTRTPFVPEAVLNAMARTARSTPGSAALQGFCNACG